MAIRLMLVTHASTVATGRFPGDEPLDSRGRAMTAGRTLRRFDGIRRGPERRCAETAALLGVDAVPDLALADLDLGEWRGRTPADVEADLASWLTDPAAVPHGGEPVSALLERVADWLAGLPGPRSRLAAITHPAVVRAAVLYALGAPPACFWRLDAGPLTQTWLTRENGRWQVRETGHSLAGGGIGP
jgi:broad specificity phosphatase PhoE